MARSTIAELEKLVNESEDGAVEIKPNGEVVKLNCTELMEKNLRLEQERNTALRDIIDRHRKVIQATIESLKGLL